MWVDYRGPLSTVYNDEEISCAQMTKLTITATSCLASFKSCWLLTMILFRATTRPLATSLALNTKAKPPTRHGEVHRMDQLLDDQRHKNTHKIRSQRNDTISRSYRHVAVVYCSTTDVDSLGLGNSSGVRVSHIRDTAQSMGSSGLSTRMEGMGWGRKQWLTFSD